MTDDDFIYQFETCTLDPAAFKHQGHLRVAWIYLQKYTLNDALKRTCDGIKRYATHLGAAHIYHETLTRAWVYIVNSAQAANKSENFENFITENPQLFDKSLIYNYYTQELLFSEKAKKEWVKPDLKQVE